MGKNRKRKRQRQQTEAAPQDGGQGSSNHDNSSTSMSSSIIHDEDLEIAVDVLSQIAANPHQLADKRYKELRKALHPLIIHQLSHQYQHGTDYRMKVTQFLSNQQWADALASLEGCRDFGQVPKQGTLQRWVRDVDLCRAPCKLQLLNAILRLGSGQEEDGDNDTTTTQATTTTTPTLQLNRHDPRLAILELQQHNQNGGEENNISGGTDAASSSALNVQKDWASRDPVMFPDVDYDANLPTVTLHSRILYQEAAADRTPPNHYDLLLHTTTQPGTIPWEDRKNTAIQIHHVPFLQSQKGDAMVLQDVLSLEECQQLRAAATQLGWRPDHPTSLPAPTGIDSCEWLVDDSILQVLSDRVRPYIQDLMSTKKGVTNTTTNTGDDAVDDDDAPPRITFHSINPRWRFFRYGPGCVYRPHIDGSWPASRIDANGDYECYSTDEDGTATIKSFHTFLIYLNDNFEGGPTRFYIPSSHGLVAQGVMPRCGSVLVFSQGNTASLLHEGSAVTSGYKYVIRTDVLYKISKR